MAVRRHTPGCRHKSQDRYRISLKEFEDVFGPAHTPKDGRSPSKTSLYNFKENNNSSLESSVFTNPAEIKPRRMSTLGVRGTLQPIVCNWRKRAKSVDVGAGTMTSVIREFENNNNNTTTSFSTSSSSISKGRKSTSSKRRRSSSFSGSEKYSTSQKNISKPQPVRLC